MNEDRALYKNLMYSALEYAKFSRDPSTQNCAILYNPKIDLILLQQNNSFPDKIKETKPRWQRPNKYFYVEHAERNIIYRAASLGIQTEGMELIAVWAACVDCARAIIQSGITKLVRLKINNSNERWIESIKYGDELLKEAGVEIFELSDKLGVSLLQDGKLVTL